MKGKKLLGIVLSLATVMSTFVVPAPVKAADTIIFSENFEDSTTYTVSGHTLSKVGGVDVIADATTGWVRAQSDGSSTAMLFEPGNISGDTVAKIRIPVTIPIDDGDYEYSFKFKAERHSGYIMSLGNPGTGAVGSEKKMNFAGTSGDTLYYYYENTNSYTGFTSCSGSVPRDYTTIKYILHTDTKTFDMYVGATQVASGATWYYDENKTNGIEWIDFYTSYNASKNGTDTSSDTYSKYWVDDILVKKLDPNAVDPDPTPTPTQYVQTFDDLAIGDEPVTVTDMANADDSVVNVQNSPVVGAGKALKAVIGANNTTVKVDFGNLSLTNGKKYKISYKMYPESYTSRTAAHMPYIYSGSTNVAGGQISGTTLHPIWTAGIGSVDLSTWATQHPNEYITIDYVVTLGSNDNGTMIINGEKYTGYVWANVSSISSIDFNFAAASGNTVIWFDDISVTEYVAPTSYSEDFEGMEIGEAWTAATEGGSGEKTNTAKVVNHNGNKVLEVNMNSANSYTVTFDFSDLGLEDGKDYKVSYKLYPKNPGTRKIQEAYMRNATGSFAGGYTVDIVAPNTNLIFAPMYYTGTGLPTVDLTNWAANNPDEYIEIEYVITQGAASGSKYICYMNGTKYTSQSGSHSWGAGDLKELEFWWYSNDAVDPTNPEIYYIDDVKVTQAADIDDIILTDASDNEISSLTGLTSVKAAVTLTAPIDNYVIIAAVVDGEGNLKAVTPHTATASTSENMTISIPTGANDNWNIKFMIWDGFTNIKPLVEPVMRPKNMVNLYVNPTAPNGGDGTYDMPFNTISVARDSARAVDKTTNNVTVHLADGYYTEGTLAFTAEDTNTKFVATGNHAVIANATQKPLSSFTTTTNTKVPSSVRSNVKEITLTAAEVGTYQALGLSGHGADTLTSAGVNVNQVNRSIPIITFDDTLGKIARYPNSGYMPITTVKNAGSVSSTPVTKTRVQSAETVAKRWTGAQLSGGAMIGGFFYHDWSDQYMPIFGTEDNDTTIVMSEPSAYGARTSGKFYIYNLLEELDTPGEWFFDASANKLYVYPPTGTTNVNISLSHDSDAIQITNSKNLTFDGITVEGATGNGIEIANTDGVTIKNCKVMNSSQYGIYAETINENLLISGCTVENIGGVGIRVNGGDRTTLTSWNNKIANCTAHDFAQYERTYSAGIDITGVEVNVSGCTIYNAPHLAMKISGNDHRVLSNTIYNVMTDGAKDMGAIYTGRSMTARGTLIDNNEIYNVGTSVPSSSEAFSTINGPYAVYLDDLQCGYTITNNRIHDIKGSGVFINGGRDNKVNNNTFNNISLSCVRITNFGMPAPNGGNGAGFDPTVAESKTKFDLKDEYMTDIYFNKYPNLENILSDNPTWPKYNDISNNTFYWGTDAKQIYWNGNSATDTTYYTAQWQEADFRNKGENTSSGNR